ncbi:hypothetical protein PUN28_017495 [Cardiocondyla obscurior]|uniref:Cytochrome P450 n=2 Tax=Cardiocondyla obscurior TaxID=286306 RepID=A0AAW2EJU0_9HYME
MMALITPYWGLDGIIVVTTLFITLYLYMTRKFNYWKKRGVVEATPTPFFGSFVDCILLKKSPGLFFQELYDQAKGLPYIGFYVLDKPFILIRDRELVKNVLIKDFNSFVDRYGTPDQRDRLGYCNPFFLKNPAWKHLRTKLTPLFTSGKLKKIFELMLECGKNLDAYLKSLDLEDKELEMEVKDLTARFSTDIIGITAYGLNVNSVNNPDAEFRKHGRKIFDFDIIRAFEFLATFFFPPIVSILRLKFFGKETTNFLRDVLWGTITERIKSGAKRNDLIDHLIELRNTYADQDVGGFKYDGDDLVAQAAVFFTAGYETSSSAVSFTLYELAIHPEIQERLRKEIHDALEETDGKITYDMLTKLQYLDMVIAETLRMYPPLPFLDRVTLERYKVPNSDLVLEKNTPIYISMTGMHYDPEYYPDPNKFDPERFTEENKRNRPPCIYFPFGEGPRICIGMRMGLLQTKLAIVTILRNYEVTPSKNTPIPMVIDPKALLTTPVGGGINLNIRKIKLN